MTDAGRPRLAGFATYQEAIDFLFAMVDYEKLSSYKYSLPNFDLRGTERMLGSVGNPHKTMKLLHIAGTKGKGSTAIMAQSILTKCGYKTGLFTSPHLVDLEERMTIDGRMVPKDDVRRIMGTLRPYVDSIRREAPEQSPTFFELVTALGFCYFAEQKVDYGVIEVGMGGRLDSTNVIRPLVSIISHLDFDHVRQLGPTLDRIAWEKAGIIKPGVPVVCAPQRQDALAVIEKTCCERNAPLHLLGRDFVLSDVESSLTDDQPHCCFTLRTPARLLRNVCMPLLGRHQASNAALAIRSVEILEETGECRLSEQILRDALAQVRCPARIEVIPGTPLVILDGAHNVAAMEALREVLVENLSGRRLFFVFGVARDKDVDGIIQRFAPLASGIAVTRSDSPRAVPSFVLLEKAKQVPHVEVIGTEDAIAALEQAKKWARGNDVIIITGSLYLAGKLRPYVRPEEYPTPVAKAVMA